MKRMILKSKRILGYVMVCLCLLICMAVSVEAAEADGAAIATLQQTTQDVEIKEEPDAKADTLSNLSVGTAVIVYGEPQDSWSRVEYKGIRGYIESSLLIPYNTGDMEQEFQAVEEDTVRIIDEYELAQKERRTSIIWGVVIAVLVVGIFAVGIISALKKNNEGDES